MNILHIAAHMGDGAGKAIGGLAISANRLAEHTHRILLLETPVKLNHIERCKNNGVEILARNCANEAIADADVVIINWWSGAAIESFLADFPKIACRVILWSHKNGFYNPPLPDALIKACDYLMATSPLTLDNQNWHENSALVYGFGDFVPKNVLPKNDYNIKKETFIIGYVGSPSYKKLPQNYLDYCEAVIQLIPNCRFVLVGETTEALQSDIAQRGLTSYFDLLGWVTNAETLLHTFDAFGYLLCPDTYATTENAVIEAMAAAVPTVVSKVPLGQYLLEDGVSGFLAENPTQYGQMMFKLYSDEQLRRQIGQAGRGYTIKTYCVADNLQRFNAACVLVASKSKCVHNFERVFIK